MIKHLVGYQIRRYKSKKDGLEKEMCILYCVTESPNVVGNMVEEILLFNPQVYTKLSEKYVNHNIEVSYRINGTSAFIEDIKLV